MRQMASTAILLTLLLAVSPAGALEEDGGHRSPGTLAAEGLEKIFQALDLFIDSIPRFEPPAVTEEGDIILRRKREPRRDAEPGMPPPSGRWIAI